MVVWIAEAEYDFEDYQYTLGVFSSDEKAYAFIQKLKDDGEFPFDREHVTRHVLDNPGA